MQATRITDACTREKTNEETYQKLDSMPFDSEPKNNSPCYLTSGAVYNALLVKADKTALATKYDSSNIELGTATLTPYSTQIDRIKSATCPYEKIGGYRYCQCHRHYERNIFRRNIFNIFAQYVPFLKTDSTGCDCALISA